MNEPRAPAARIARMIESDLPAVLAVERASFREPWTANAFRSAIRSEGASEEGSPEGGGVRARVLRVGAACVGYFVLELRPRRARLTNLAVAPAYRRRGHASRMLIEVDRLCLRDAARRAARAERGPEEPADEHRPLCEIALEVEESNLAAQLLYRTMGYRATSVLRDHYPRLGEDGYRMKRLLHDAPIGTVS